MQQAKPVKSNRGRKPKCELRVASIAESANLPIALPEPNLILSNNSNIQKQDLEIIPVEVKINLPKPVRNDSLREEFANTPRSKDELSNKANKSNHKSNNEVSNHSRMEIENIPKQPVLAEAVQQMPSPDDDLTDLHNRLMNYQMKTEHIMKKLGEWVYMSQFSSTDK